MPIIDKNINEIIKKRKICIDKLLKLCQTLMKSNFYDNEDEFSRIIIEKKKELVIFKNSTEMLNTYLKQNMIILNKENLEELNNQEKKYNDYLEKDKSIIENIKFHIDAMKDKLKKKKMQSKIYNAYKAF